MSGERRGNKMDRPRRTEEGGRDVWVQLRRCPRRGVARGGRVAARPGRRPVSGAEGCQGAGSCTSARVRAGRFQNEPGPFPSANVGQVSPCSHLGSPSWPYLYVPWACVPKCRSFFSSVYSQYLRDLSSDLEKSGDCREVWRLPLVSIATTHRAL